MKKKNIKNKKLKKENEKISHVFETFSLTQRDILIDKKSNLAVPNLSNVMESKKFSEEHEQ